MYVCGPTKTCKNYHSLNLKIEEFITVIHTGGDQDSIVSIVSRYGLDSLRIESQWRQDFLTHPDQPWGPSSLLYIGYWLFPRSKAAWGMVLNTHPLLV